MQIQNYTYPTKKQGEGEKKQVVSLLLIQKAISEGRTRHLAAYYILKRIYECGKIYDYRTRMAEIASLVGICKQTLYTYLKYLRAAGLVWDTGSTLMLAGTYTIKKAMTDRRMDRIEVRENDRVEDVEHLLMAKHLEHRARRMEFMRAVGEFEGNNGRRETTTYPNGCETLPAYSLSYKTISIRLNISIRKARKLVRYLNQREIISTQRNRPKAIGKATRGVLPQLEDDHAHYFVFNGILFRVFGNKHTFLDYPPRKQKLTPKRYVKFLQSGQSKKGQDYIPMLYEELRLAELQNKD